VCGKTSVTPVSIGYKVYVEKSNQKQPIGGLVAFQCEQEGHVFFVMSKDVEDAAA
jgi:hypothetical protein